LAHIEGDSYPPTEPDVVASVASTFSTSLSLMFGVSDLLLSQNSSLPPNTGPEYAPEEPEPVASLVSDLLLF
jgi:hypothetical protein